MRVLALQTGFSLRAGGGRVDYGTLQALAAQKHSVLVALPGRAQFGPQLPAGLHPVYTGGRGLRFPQSLGLTSIPGLLRTVRSFRPDIIRDHSPYAFGFASLLLQRLAGVPVVGSFLHPEASGHFGWVERNLYRRYAHITTISKASARQLENIDPATRGKISTVYMGISDEYRPGVVIDEREWRLAHGLPAEEPIFCTSGSLVPRKNHVFLLEVVEAWKRQGRRGVLVIAGEGELRRSLERAIDARGLGGWVMIWPPYAPMQELEARAQSIGKDVADENEFTHPTDYIRLLHVATAFLFPSRMEGFGFSPAEALASGLPAIVSDRGALPELVRQGETGFVLPIDEGPQPWLAALQRLCQSPNLRTKMGQRAAADMRARFSWQRTGRETAAVYERVIAEWHGRRS